jgi:CheY-like chemotaxis protein
LIADVLRELGYDCIEASDAYSAMPVLESDAHLDLMISDVGLPGLNGRQLAANARKHRPGLKVLFVTGYADQAAGPEPFLEPGMEMVTKPFLPDALASKIHQMIAG